MIDIGSITQFFSQGFWQYVWAGNTLGEYTFAMGTFLLGLLILKYVQWIVLRVLKKSAAHTKTDIDDTLVEIVGSVRPPFYSFLAFYIAIRILAFSDVTDKAITAILLFWQDLVLVVLRWRLRSRIFSPTFLVRL
jgi:hypothetical protein